MVAQQSPIPTRVYGVDPLPVRCSNCGSRGLGVEAPVGADLGRQVCTMCSQQMCWLRQPTPGPALVKLSRFVRRPTCSEECSALDGHDPDGHEVAGRGHAQDGAYKTGYQNGYDAGFRMGVAAPDTHARCMEITPLSLAGVVEVGPLTIDGAGPCVTLDGRALRLSKREAQMLCVLAARQGRAVRYREIVASVWGERADGTARTLSTQAHLCRVTMIRLRAKLGDAGRMLETVGSVGYRLVEVSA